MKTMKGLLVLFFVVMGFIPIVPLRAQNNTIVNKDQVTALYISSSNENLFGKGLSITPDDAQFISRAGNHTYVGIQVFMIHGGGIFHFQAPQGQELKDGTSFKATRWPFQKSSVAGLDYSWDGSGYNTLTGKFKVLEITFDKEGQMLSFAADFVQFKSESEEVFEFGSIRYYSGIPITKNKWNNNVRW